MPIAYKHSWLIHLLLFMHLFFALQKMVWHFAKYSAEIQTLSNYSEKAV